MEIRLAEPRDAADIQAIYAPIVADTAISFEIDPPSVDEMAQRVAKTAPRYPWLVADDGGAILGYAYAGPHRDRHAYDWSVDVSVYVGQGHHRRGLGRALYAPLLELLRVQGFGSALAGIALPNPASIGLHESLGFVPIGIYRHVGWKNGVWHDVGWWQRTLINPDGGPQPLRSLADLTPAELGVLGK